MSSTGSSCLMIPKLHSQNSLQSGLPLIARERAGGRPEFREALFSQPGLRQACWGQQGGGWGLQPELRWPTGNYKETLQRTFLLWLFPLFTLGSSVIS